MSKRVMVKMRKLDNNGKPFLHNGEEVFSEFDPHMADRILSLKGARWERVSETPIEAPKVSHENPVPADEVEEKEEEKVEEAPKKKAGRPKKNS